MKRFMQCFATAVAIAVGATALLALPSAVFAGGICENLCGACYSSPEVECAALDGCSKSKNECYFATGPCPSCEAT